jgi:hypothetical protein
MQSDLIEADNFVSLDIFTMYNQNRIFRVSLENNHLDIYFLILPWKTMAGEC